MGLDRYKPARARFTWRRRRVDNSASRTSQKVLADCKDQRGHGGKCAYFAICNCMEAHQRQKTNLSCPELSWRDLENKVACAEMVEGQGRVSKCFSVIQREGVRYEGSEETLKIEKFESINVKKSNEVFGALKEYLVKGPMVGTFEVSGGRYFDAYGESKAEDRIYFVSKIAHEHIWTHVVTITGFGVQGMWPFWEFQNSYGPKWRGAAHGFGLIYAVHLLRLYGFTLLP